MTWKRLEINMFMTRNIIIDSVFLIIHEKRNKPIVRIKERIAITAIIIYIGSVLDVDVKLILELKLNILLLLIE